MKTTIYSIYRKTSIILKAACFIFYFSNAWGQSEHALIKLDFTEQNGEKYVKATAYHLENDSIGDPIADLDLYFYVQRTFSQLPIGDRFNTTDENGEITVEFPSDLPGDSLGNVELIVKIQEADEYADTTVNATLKWGIPLVSNENESERTLWAAGANAPISLLVLTNLLILVAWGIIIYIVTKIYSISKM